MTSQDKEGAPLLRFSGCSTGPSPSAQPAAHLFALFHMASFFQPYYITQRPFLMLGRMKGEPWTHTCPRNAPMQRHKIFNLLLLALKRALN